MLDILKKDNLLVGLAIALFLPIVAYALLLGLNDLIEDHGNSIGLRSEFRFSEKLIQFIAICFNVIPSQYFLNKKKDNTIRGLSLRTFGLIIVWGFYHLPEILSTLKLF